VDDGYPAIFIFDVCQKIQEEGYKISVSPFLEDLKNVPFISQYDYVPPCTTPSYDQCVHSIFSNIINVNAYAISPSGVCERINTMPKWSAQWILSLQYIDPNAAEWKAEELKQGQIPVSTAAGSDGILARLWRSVPASVVIRIYNILMWCRKLPEVLLKSRTVFLPKMKDARGLSANNHPLYHSERTPQNPGERMDTMLDIDVRQRAFRSTDGCADNTFLLDTLLRYHRKNFKPLYMASLDVSKAFDSVSQRLWKP